MAALSKEITAYERMSEDIEAEHRGRYPLIWSDDCREPRRPLIDVVAAARVGERQQVAAVDDARVVPFLGSANVDDGHSRFSQLLECGDVDLGHLGTKQLARDDEGGNHEYRPQHRQFLRTSCRSQ